MIQIRKSEERGHFNHGWLDTYHTFSFGRYHDRRFMGFRDLRVINEDVVAPGTGFGEHPHRDMEIITYIISGELEHRDSLGNGAILKPGDVQYMASGTGIVHAEFNPSPDVPVHLIQIWIHPDTIGLTPRYRQSRFPAAGSGQELTLLASPNGENGSISIHQDVKLWAVNILSGQEIQLAMEPNRHGWIQVIGGRLASGDRELSRGDGVSWLAQDGLRLIANEDSRCLYFDLK